MKGSVFVRILVSAAALLQLVHSQECESITIDMLGSTDVTMSTGIISSLIGANSQGASGPSVLVIEMNIVCEAQAINKDRYRFTSVVASFNCSSPDSRVTLCQNASVVHTVQFDLGCTLGNEWSRNSLGSSSTFLTVNPIATLATGLDSQCAACLHSNHSALDLRNTSVSDDTHCEACRGCTEGMRRCTEFNNAPGEDCCNYFDEGICVGECPGTLVGGSDFECRCSVLSDDNGVIIFSNNQETGSVANLTCDTGYELSGAESTTCGVDGWAANLTCTPVQCEQLASITDGELSYTDETNFNSVATYTCIPGFSLNGEATRTCMSDRMWSGMEPNCTMTTLPLVTECNVGCIIGIVVGIIVLIVLIIIAIIIAVILCKCCNKKDSSVSSKTV